MGLISLDTNVLIRYLTRDDLSQFVAASQLIQDQLASGEPVRITLLVALESEWVLRSRYRFSKAMIIKTFVALLGEREIIIEDEAVFEQALQWWQTHGVHFANCLIVAKSHALGFNTVATFDVKAGRLPGVQLVAPS